MTNTIPKVLLVEDDPNLGLILKDYLDLKGYAVDLRENGEDGLAQFQKEQYDICLFDIMMPKMDGFTLIRQVRQLDQSTPVIFITARSMNQDKIEGFKLGADDYLTKPFSMEELQLRIEAVLRRTASAPNPKADRTKFELGNLSFDFHHQILKNPEGEQRLTSKESSLLKLLCDYQNDLMPREYALKLIWNEDNYFTARSMDVYITKLRKYLKLDPRIEIKNVHGKGYKLISPESEVTQLSS